MTIKAYNATGELARIDPFTLGSRVLLTCNVTNLSGGNEMVRYRWYHNCTNGRCQIYNRRPYYRVVKHTLLVDVISRDQGGKYICFVNFNNIPQSSDSISKISIAG